MTQQEDKLMQLAQSTPLYPAPRHSAELQELQAWFNQHKPPYSLQDVVAFHAMYQAHYPLLSPEEKRLAEGLVDALIEGAGRREWEARVFGAT
jgi:hypothetical protein